MAEDRSAVELWLSAQIRWVKEQANRERLLSLGLNDLGAGLNQTTELVRVKTRIKALAEKTVANGCTEAEALSAAEMVGRLLEQYSLSMDEIEVRTSRCVQAEVPLGGRRRRAIDGCVPAIARFCDCKVWLARAPKPDPDDEPPKWPPPVSRYIFFGFEADTALATYLFAVIDRAIQVEADAFRRTHPNLRAGDLRRASASFQHGVAARVAGRLAAMHKAREATVRAQRSTGNALILVKHQAVEDAFSEAGVRLVSMAAVGKGGNAVAYREGWVVGARVNLNRPVHGERRRMLA